MPHTHRHAYTETYTQAHTHINTWTHTNTDIHMYEHTHMLTLIYTILWQGFLKNRLKSKENVFFFLCAL